MAINEVTVRRLSSDIKKAFDSQIPKKIKGKMRVDISKKNKKISRLISEAIGKFVLEAEVKGVAEGLVSIESVELGSSPKIKWSGPVVVKSVGTSWSAAGAGRVVTTGRGIATGHEVVPKFKNVRKPHSFSVKGKVVWQGKKPSWLVDRGLNFFNR